jgi:hypothetical protein
MRLIVFLVLWCSMFAPAHAAFLEYNIVLTVTEGTLCETIGEPDDGFSSTCSPAPIGSMYLGRFSVDDSVVSTDGAAKSGVLGYFYLQIESLVWGYNWPTDNTFAGFYDVNGFASAPSFDVLNGQVVNLVGGVYSGGDDPAVDFSASAGPTGARVPNTFAASGGLPRWPAVGESLSFLESGRGTMAITPVPLPAAAWLLGSALASLAWRRRR